MTQASIPVERLKQIEADQELLKQPVGWLVGKIRDLQKENEELKEALRCNHQREYDCRESVGDIGARLVRLERQMDKLVDADD